MDNTHTHTFVKLNRGRYSGLPLLPTIDMRLKTQQPNYLLLGKRWQADCPYSSTLKDSELEIEEQRDKGHWSAATANKGG